MLQSLSSRITSTIIQSLWVGNKLSQVEKLSIASFLYHGHSYHLYAYDDIPDLPDGTLLKDANEIIPEKEIFTTHNGSYATFSELFRWTLLRKKGHYWADTDLVCLKPFDFETDIVFGLESEDYANPCLMKFPPNHALSRFIETSCRNPNDFLPYDSPKDKQRKLERRQLNEGKGLFWGEAGGPYGFTRALKHFGMLNLAKPFLCFYPIHYGNWRAIFEQSWPDGLASFSDSYTIHLWNEMMRQDKSFDKNATFPEFSLFEQLKRKYLSPPIFSGSGLSLNPPGAEQGSRKNERSAKMKMKAQPLYEQAVDIAPSPKQSAWATENKTVAANLALNSAGERGWDLLCPYAVEVTWNGGPNPEDIDIRLDRPPDDAPAFVQSYLGQGLLTFYPGYQIQIEGPNSLWVRGPINRPKAGLSPLEQIVDTALLPVTISLTWQLTRPGQTIRFEAGEPFGTLVPYPTHFAEQFEWEVSEPDEEIEAMEQALDQLVDNPALYDVFQRLGATNGSAAVAVAPAVVETKAGARQNWAAQLVDPPPVSCICPVYGRVELLEEAIYSFLQQDYPGQKELIVLNDYAGQTLDFDHPEVRVVNIPHRFNSIGEKYKAAVALCAHDLIFVWHDDDIYLPHRLSFSVANFNQEKGFFKANRAWMWEQGHLSGPEQNLFHGGSCWRRELFVETHGYPHISTGYDLEFEELCRDERPTSFQIQPMEPEDIYYIYRWNGTGSYHFSVIGQNGHAYQDVAAYVQQQVDRGNIKQGRITLKPHWQSDYQALVQSFLDSDQVKQFKNTVEDEIPFPPPFHVIPPPPPLADDAIAGLFQGTYPAKISVILPAANESVLLQRTVEQFEATLPDNSEIIVVDNGSHDGCADFLVADRSANVHLIQTTESLGVAGARNCGLDLAQGEIVVFADAHIDLPERWWQPMVATLNRPEVGVVGPGIGVMGRPEHSVSYGQYITFPKLGGTWWSKQRDTPYPAPSLGGGFMAMRHDTLKQAGAFDAGMPEWGSEDLELCIRYWLLGYEVWVVPEVTVLHYFRTTNPNKARWQVVSHNLLRVALLHFSHDRLAQVISALKTDAKFGDALALAADSDVWQQRADLAARRVRDDDWLFETFKEGN
ncbi:MAG TPA: DUF6065 family protein [Anaerolineae bacterium]|nr:DUF6065 family protein [Anaerolineae bacterium]